MHAVRPGDGGGARSLHTIACQLCQLLRALASSLLMSGGVKACEHAGHKRTYCPHLGGDSSEMDLASSRC